MVNIHLVKIQQKVGNLSYGDVNGPWGIAIDEEGYSIVSENNGNCLSIFDPQGNKIHTVGNLCWSYSRSHNW